MKCAVITGLGIVSDIGNNQQEVLTSLHEGHPEITFPQELKDSGIRNHVWGNVKLDTTGFTDRKAVRSMSDASAYVFFSMGQAIANAGFPPKAYQNDPRAGLITDSDNGSPRFQVLGADAMCGPCGLKAVDSYVIAKAIASDVSVCLVTPLKAHGVNYSISSACATSAHCIGNAVKQIQLGKQDIVFTGDGEELCWEMTCEFDVMDAPLTKYSDTPGKASRTYGAHRDGFAITGGGGMVVVKGPEHALVHGAHICTEIAGYDATSGSADMVAPSGGGAVRRMKMAIHGIDTPIDYLNSYGTSAPVGDVKELVAIREVLGDKSPAISTTRAMTGHSLSATGVQEAIYSLLMLEHGFIAPSISTKELGEQAMGLNIMTETADRELTTAMSSSFGSGSTNITLVMHRLKDQFAVGRGGRTSIASDIMRQCGLRY